MDLLANFCASLTLAIFAAGPAAESLREWLAARRLRRARRQPFARPLGPGAAQMVA
jgi:hypothetical protein